MFFPPVVIFKAFESIKEKIFKFRFSRAFGFPPPEDIDAKEAEIMKKIIDAGKEAVEAKNFYKETCRNSPWLEMEDEDTINPRKAAAFFWGRKRSEYELKKKLAEKIGGSVKEDYRIQLYNLKLSDKGIFRKEKGPNCSL